MRVICITAVFGQNEPFLGHFRRKKPLLWSFFRIFLTGAFAVEGYFIPGIRASKDRFQRGKGGPGFRGVLIGPIPETTLLRGQAHGITDLPPVENPQEAWDQASDSPAEVAPRRGYAGGSVTTFRIRPEPFALKLGGQEEIRGRPAIIFNKR
jgi:hypothetical protein